MLKPLMRARLNPGRLQSSKSKKTAKKVWMKSSAKSPVIGPAELLSARRRTTQTTWRPEMRSF
jgi:hypothetical protein